MRARGGLRPGRRRLFERVRRFRRRRSAAVADRGRSGSGRLFRPDDRGARFRRGQRHRRLDGPSDWQRDAAAGKRVGRGGELGTRLLRQPGTALGPDAGQLRPRNWWTADEHAASPVKGPLPTGPTGGGYTLGALVAEVLDNTPGKIIGYPVVDGRPTIELSASVPGSQFQFWVDSRTYQVIRTAKYFTGGLNVPPLVSDYDWVRATAALVNLINHPQVPAGFTRVHVGQYYTNK